MTEAELYRPPLFEPKVCPKGWHKEYIHLPLKYPLVGDATITIFVRGTRKKKNV